MDATVGRTHHGRRFVRRSCLRSILISYRSAVFDLNNNNMFPRTRASTTYNTGSVQRIRVVYDSHGNEVNSF